MIRRLLMGVVLAVTVTTLGIPFLRNAAAFTALYANARLIVEMAWGADLAADPDTWTWTDITGDVRQSDGQTINISPMGRGDNTSKTQPAACTFVVDNTSGIYSRGAQSPNYPNVRQNVPVRVWVTLTGDEVDKRIRFQGEVWSFRPSWDQTGTLATVTVSAAGKMRQLTQGATPLRTPLQRAITQAAPVAAWLLDDPAGVLSAAPIDPTTTAPLLPSQSTEFNTADHGTVTFGAASTLPGTSAAAQLTTGAQLVAPLPVYDTGSGFFAASVWFLVPPGTDGLGLGTTIFTLRAADGSFYESGTTLLDASNPPAAALTGVSSSPDTTLTTLDTSTNLTTDPQDGTWHELFVTFQQVGPDVQVASYLDGQLGESDTLTSKTLGRWASIIASNFYGLDADATGPIVTLGPISVYTDPAAEPTWTAGFGWTGELATDRLTRLCGQAGVPLTIVGTSTTTMGPQSADTLVNLLRECETADLGVLGDGLGPGLYYVCRSSRYNQNVSMALDATDLAAPPQPEDDDQKLRNRYTVSRAGGGTATFEDTAGPQGTLRVGVYDTDGGQVNVADDTPLLNIAAWLVHLGTVDGYRYPQLPLDIRISPAHADEWAAMTPGARLTVDGIADVSPQHPPDALDLLAEGWSEVLSPFVWTAVANCESAGPWRIFTVEDAQLGRLGFDGQALLADVDADDTAWVVDSPIAPALTTSATFPDDFPYEVEVEGEVVQITATTDLLADAFGRSTSGGWGTADSGQTWTHEGGSSAQASVSAGAGHHAVATIGTTCRSLMAGPADLEATWRVSIPSVATGVAAQSGFIVREDGANANLVIFRLLFNVDGTIIPRISKRVASAETTLATAGSVLPYSGGTWIRARALARGQRLALRCWLDGTPEPPADFWHLDIEDSTFLAAGRVGFRSDTPSGWLGGSPFTFSYDDVQVVNPQTVTVVRSINGLAKPHTAGALLALYRPGVLAL